MMVLERVPPARWPYVIRRCTLNSLLGLPGVAGLNDRRSAARSGSMHDPDYLLGIFSTHLERFHAHGGTLEDLKALELGPGRSLGQSMLLCALGAEQVQAVDIREFATASQAQGVYGILAERLEELVTEGKLPTVLSLDEILDRVRGLLPPGREFPKLDGRLRYSITDGTRIPSGDGSCGFVYSCSVLEHVDHPADVYQEMARATRPGGLWSHMIDLSDHCHPDPHDFLRYGDGLWSLMQSRSPGFTNRLRASDHLSMIESAGMSVLMVKPTFAEEGPGRARCHPRFESYADDDLRTIAMAVVARKAAA